MRILASPFVLVIMLITYSIQLIKYFILFLVQGGEFIIYEKDEIKTIGGIYDKLKELKNSTIKISNDDENWSDVTINLK